ncbi:MAG TPA: polysaccharide biosynthesis tyrosine autokinase [Flavobacteriales bacterium]|nr:polysaccharide biosynthesis tyrosine autokinase [Flavobacteriales bacterium]HIO59367.1 polysaccharide biosynthesis tyrosine autokinase [Flavobacteriales bacterium]
MNNSRQDIVSAEDIRPYVKLLGKSGWLMVLLAVIGYGIGRVVTHRQVDKYNATAEILLTRGGGVSDLQGMGNARATAMWGSYLDETRNQIRILNSYDLIGRSIDKINDPLDLFLVGRLKELPVGGFSVLDIDVQAEAFAPSMLGKSLNLFIQSSTTYKITFETKDGGIVEIDARFGDLVTAHGLNISVALSKEVRFDSARTEAAKEQHFRIRVYNRNNRIYQYRSQMTAGNIEMTSIVTLTCSNVLPSRAKRFLDTLASTYIDYTAEARHASNLQAEEYIDNQLIEIESMTDSLAQLVDYYKDQKNIIDLSKEQAQYFSMLVDLERNRRELDLQIESLNSLNSYLITSSSNTALPPTSFLFVEDKLMLDQMGELFALQARRSSLLLDVKEGASVIRRVDSTLSQIRTGIKRYLGDFKSALEGRRDDLNVEIRLLEVRLASLPQTQRDILAMERKLAVNEKLSLFLLEQKATTIIARANITPEASLIERARYAGLVGPNKQRTILTYVLAGFVLGIVIALIRLFFFARIDSTGELREVAKFPVIGGIPFHKGVSEDPLAVRADNRSSVTEAFRALRTNLQYLLAKEGANVILVSSLHPSEGKSFVSSNLASILAKAGKKVAMIDFDLHKPRIHEYFGLKNRAGTSNLLVGKATISDVKTTGPYPTLDIISAGPIPPNASDLILSERMKPLIAELKKEYDYVILDTPPILLISDALVLMQHVDTALLVTNTSQSSRRGIRHLEDLLEQNSLSHASFVLNGIKPRRLLKYYSKYAARYGYYSYGSGYAEGYGYGETYVDNV